MKFTTEKPLMQHAHAFEVVQDGRIYIEKINGPFLYVDRGPPEEHEAGLALAIEAAGWNSMIAEDLREVRPSRGGPVRLWPQCSQ